MSLDAVALRVREVIAKELRRPLPQVVPSASFTGDLQADSLEIVELVMAMERAFDVKIPDAEAEKLRTVQDAIDFVHRCLS